MANIEKRRIQRKTLLILAAAAALITIGAVAALLIIFIPRINNREAAVPTEPALTAEPSPAPSAEPSLPPETEAPTQAVPTSNPVRVSDEMSVMLFSMNLISSSDDDGTVYYSISGSAAVEFVNNTDRALYSADLFIGGMNVDCVTLDGTASGFSVSDDGILTVPFLDVLEPNESCEFFFSFSMFNHGEEIAVPYFSYETAYELRLSILSDIPLIVPGAAERNDGERYVYENEGGSVSSVIISFPN